MKKFLVLTILAFGFPKLLALMSDKKLRSVYGGATIGQIRQDDVNMPIGYDLFSYTNNMPASRERYRY